MNYLLLITTIFFLITTIWIGWLYIHLRRQLGNYVRMLRQALPAIPPMEVEGLEELASAVQSLVAAFNSQVTSLKDESARLAAVLDQMTDGVLMVDPEGRIQFANPAAERLFGEKPLGHSVTETLRHYQLIEAWQRGRDTGQLQTESVEIPARRQFLQLVVIPDRHTPGGGLLLVQDLTRLRRLETVRRDFIGNLSHELRTPLASLKALTETLHDGALEDPPAARRFIDQIQVEVDALSQMVKELLELSNIESGRLSLELRTIAASDLLSSAAERMRLQAERAGLSLQVECQEDLPRIRVDAARLEQVLVNLIHNAVKFSRPGGEIVLSAEPDDHGVCIAVRDTGVGIPADDLPRIFERFYKSDRSRSGGGTGLGLSIARHVIEAHQGKIWVESVEGQGSTFYFTCKSA
jgi:two-component system phosphate regulon sensor histidine kinase PhoR